MYMKFYSLILGYIFYKAALAFEFGIIFEGHKLSFVWCLGEKS